MSRWSINIRMRPYSQPTYHSTRSPGYDDLDKSATGRPTGGPKRTSRRVGNKRRRAIDRIDLRREVPSHTGTPAPEPRKYAGSARAYRRYRRQEEVPA